ncbi:MAG: hypothetical protein OXH39_08375 [Candidatus Poribacteria bacterium]|nr:hypothetical protein [Candidatus Poribacteria bacterium]
MQEGEDTILASGDERLLLEGEDTRGNTQAKLPRQQREGCLIITLIWRLQEGEDTILASGDERLLLEGEDTRGNTQAKLPRQR